MTLTCFEAMGNTLATDGRLPQLVELNNATGMRLLLMDIGASWLSCQVPVDGEKRPREVLLGVDSFADFMKQKSYMGATIGRYANRISNACFSLNNVSYHLNANQHGNCLHGGEHGFHCRRWDIVCREPGSVRFSLLSEDGDQGFPGNLNVVVTYTLTDDNQVIIDYLATTDKFTPVSLTNHAYFHLGGADQGSSCLNHQLWIDADEFLPVDEAGIPREGLISVESTGFDFRQMKPLGQDLCKDRWQKQVKGYDHAYVFRQERDVHSPVASLIAPDGKIQLYVKTTSPAMQLYTGNWLGGTPGRQGHVYSDYAGVALETGFLPDAPNHKEWQQQSGCILSPESIYTHQTVYQFRA